MNKAFHPKKNNWVGYILHIEGITYYIAGDTDITEENKKIKSKVVSLFVFDGLKKTPVESASVGEIVCVAGLENVQIGDVYNLLDTGANYVYADSGWDKLSETIDLSIYLKSTDAESTYAKITDLNDLILRVEILENKEEGGTT